MTENKALKILNNLVIEGGDKSRAKIAIDIAIKALEKQIPKKPNYEGDGYYNGELVLDTWICPNCGKSYEVDYNDYDYCPNCGQHIDHSGLTEDD